MNDEDRTFRRLRQIPIAVLDAEYHARFMEFYQKPELFKEWLDENGWFEKEFYDAGSRFTAQRKSKP